MLGWSSIRRCFVRDEIIRGLANNGAESQDITCTGGEHIHYTGIELISATDVTICHENLTKR